MTRERLKYVYNLVVAAAAALGFAIGYTLKGRTFQPLLLGTRPVRAYDRDFPGARARYNEIKRDFSHGDFVKTDYRSTVVALRRAIEEHRGYLPHHCLLAKIYEDCCENLRSGRVLGEGARVIAESLGLDPRLDGASLAEKCRQLALTEWSRVGQLPMLSSAEKFGNQWRAIRQQHINALTRERNLRVEVAPDGIVDLTPAYDVYAITRDYDRYVNNLSSFEKGPTFEEKHIPDIIRCPNHPEVAFQFPCLPYLSVEKTRTIREDVDFFRNAMTQDGQHLDLEDIPAQRIHLLCFNVTQDRRIVDSVVRVEFADGDTENYRAAIGPWMQTPDLLRDVATRRSLDPVFRDTEVHLCNGVEVETMTSPIYMYHVSVDIGSRRIIDKIAFPRHDPRSSGVALKDPGIADVRIVALSLK